MKILCEVQLCLGLDVDNVAGRLVLAEQGGAEQLREECLAYLGKSSARLKAVMITTGWKDLAAFSGMLVSEVLSLLAAKHDSCDDDTATREGGGKKRKAEDAGLMLFSSRKRVAMSEHVDLMSMARIRSEMSRRGLSILGSKADLVQVCSFPGPPLTGTSTNHATLDATHKLSLL